MELQDFLRSRRSVRRFKSTTVDMSILNRILETATYAPSAHNRQPWRFVILTRPESKIKLSEALAADFRHDLLAEGASNTEIESRINRSTARLTNSPVVVILCLDMSEMDIYSDVDGNRSKGERTMAVQSVASAGVLLMLSARAEGLDSFWTCAPLFAPQTVRETLNLTSSWEPQAMILMGYSAEIPAEKRLKPLGDVVRFID